MFIGDSSTPGSAVNAFRDLGLDLDRTGVLSLDDKKLDAALSNHFDDVVTLFSANTNNQSEFGVASRGIAGDAVKAINDLISSSRHHHDAERGVSNAHRCVQAQVRNTQHPHGGAAARLYQAVWHHGKSMVGQTNAMRESLTSTFEGMMAMYTKK